ncbi:DNA translocase FtsK [Neisseria sp. Ec49-e6-T10]|uniref:DNA translocase FtsK n=1 Tax=Neisseria sp. Ec49-e6-T10 TaxID=3140744 RepID=UPI003EC0F2CC
MLWFLLLLIVAIIAAMAFYSTKSRQEWEQELLYLTRHEGTESLEKELVLTEEVSPLLQSARQHKKDVTDFAEEIVDDDFAEHQAQQLEEDLKDLPIFAAEEEETVPTQEEQKNEQPQYYFPEVLEMPFEEQFKPVDEPEVQEPEVIVLDKPVYVKPQQTKEAPPVIDLEDVKRELLRQKLAKKWTAKQEVPVQVPLPIIDTNEVLENLAKTDSPVNRKYRRKQYTKSVIPSEALEHNHNVYSPRKKAKAPPAKEALYSQFTPFNAPKKEFANHQEIEPESEPNKLVLPHVIQVPELVDVVQNETETDVSINWQPEADYNLFLSSEDTEQDINVLPEVSWSLSDIDVSEEAETENEDQSFTVSEQEANKPSWAPKAINQPTLIQAEKPVSQVTTVQRAVFHETHLPGLNLLQAPEEKVQNALSDEILLEKGIVIEEKLAEFKVKVNVLDAYAGPVITRYEIEPAVGVRGAQVMNLVKDLSRALGLVSIRVVETIPGKTCMGLELPNPTRQMIRLSEIFASSAFIDSRSKLTLALGQDITGEPIVTDLAKAPHLLVAGTTGSGKSVGVNAMILSMLFKATPEEVRLIMIDPKMLELSIYEGIPHLLAPVVTDMKLAANALTWCVNEMEKRYRLMSHMGVRNVAGFNQKIKEAAQRGQKLANPFSLNPQEPEPLEHLPYIVVVVDEFADLMMVAGKKIEELIARLAQKARAAGIHLILATQRPSVDVITGLIKANIPTRIAFQVSSKIDSRTILDQMGAESLLGQGDMLFLPPGTGYPQRVHGAFVADEEVHRVVAYLKQFGEPNYVDDILTAGVDEGDLFSNANSNGNGKGAEDDPLYDEAVSIVLRTRKASISSVQRQLRIGYNRAARLIEQMEATGIVSPMESNGNRTVLVPDRAID